MEAKNACLARVPEWSEIFKSVKADELLERASRGKDFVFPTLDEIVRQEKELLSNG